MINLSQRWSIRSIGTKKAAISHEKSGTILDPSIPEVALSSVSRPASFLRLQVLLFQPVLYPHLHRRHPRCLRHFAAALWLGTLVAGVGGHLPDLLCNGLSNR